MYTMKKILLLMMLFQVIKTDDKLSEKCFKNKTLGVSSALMRFQGTSVSFECDICIPINEMLSDNIVEWLFNSTQNSSIVNILVELFDNVVVGLKGKLQIHNLEVRQSGNYWCSLNETVTSTTYILHVDNGSEPMRTIHPNETPQPPTLLVEYNLKIYSDYTPWSACSTCDEIGKRIRYGYCTIISTKGKTIDYDNYNSNMNIDYTDLFENEDYYYETNIKDKEKRAINKIENEESNDINYFVDVTLPTFQYKLPCRSRNVPKILQNIPSIKERKSEMMIEMCKVECKKNEVFNVRDKSGRILETANNSAGIYSMLQGIPEAFPMPVRITLYKEFNSPCELKCPGLYSNTPVVWKIGIKNPIPIEPKRTTFNRIKIDERGHIIFKKLRFSDTNIYSCWQENKLSGTIRLKVVKKVQLKFKSHMLIFGGIIILTVFSLVFWRAFKGRKRYTKH